MGNTTQARESFSSVLELQPSNSSAREGLELTSSRTNASVSLSETLHAYSGHALKEFAMGTTLSVPMTIADHYKLGVTGRYTWFAPKRMGRGQGFGQNSPSFSQGEAYAHAGVGFLNWGLVGHYAWARDSLEGSESVHVAGFSSRVEALGTIWLSGSASIHADTTIFRLEPAWTIPLGSVFSVQPLAAWQHADSENFFSSGGTFTATPGWATVFIGGRYGEERQPVYLSHPSVYNVPEHILWSVWAGARLALTKSWSLNSGYEFLRLRQLLTTGTEDADMHLFTVGLELSP